MALSSRHIVFSVIASFVVGGVVIACGSDGSTFGDGTTPSGTFSDASLGNDDSAASDPYANDPPPQYCGPDGGAAPVVTGTAQCPDDKNKPGCGCRAPGTTAPCWTGLRADRNLGVCKDGTTTCVKSTETSNVWSDCSGEVLPTVGATGAAACSCFSAGTWNIANTSPCYSTPDGTTYGAYSTNPAGPPFCDATGALPATAPATWSTDDLTVDCAGTFTLCFRIRFGDFANPSTSDCILGESCIENAVYATAKVKQTLPTLPGWKGSDAACAKKWTLLSQTDVNASPGYGEMIVKGQTVTCEAIDDGKGNEYVFNRVKYCPSIYNVAGHDQDAACVECRKDSTGTFSQ